MLIVAISDSESLKAALSVPSPAYTDVAYTAGDRLVPVNAEMIDLVLSLNTAEGSAITSLHRKHRAVEFKKFLARIDAQVPEDLDVNLICDNYQTHKTPAVKAWLDRHPRFHMHFTPTYSSWINQVERFFGLVTDDLLRCSDHRSVQSLESDIRAWVKA